MEHLTEPARIEGYEAVRLRSSSAYVDATFVPSAGMVGASLRDRGAELLHRNGGGHRYTRGGSTMGIPLLHPWANRLAEDCYRVSGTAARLDPASPRVQHDEHGLAIHGLLNGFPYWRTVEPDERWALAAEVDFSAHDELLAAFPFPHRLRLDVALRRRTLTVRTTLTATGDRPVPVAFGFHPYLRLPTLSASAGGSSCRPCAISSSTRARSRPARRERWTPRAAPSDPAHSTTASSTFPTERSSCSPAADAGSRVRLEQGYPVAQVFAPCSADVVCFEPMTAPTNALVTGDGLKLLEPGARYRATFSITVESGAR